MRSICDWLNTIIRWFMTVMQQVVYHLDDAYTWLVARHSIHISGLRVRAHLKAQIFS